MKFIKIQNTILAVDNIQKIEIGDNSIKVYWVKKHAKIETWELFHFLNQSDLEVNLDNILHVLNN